MEYRLLGRSGLRVSPLCLGVMMFGDRTDEKEAAAIVDSAREAGVNFVDTADAYAGGRSEEMLGRLIAGDRERWVVATKVANQIGTDPNSRGTSLRWLIRECDNSLKRLGTDWIDLYYLHKDDAETPMEETVAGLDHLMRAGKIRYFGVSNFRGWRIADMVATCKAMGVRPPIACQPCYNLMDRTAEVEVIPASVAKGLGVVPYSPLARGVLTAKYRPGEAPPPETRAGRNDRRIMQTEFRPESVAIAKKLETYAREQDTTPAHLALGWVLNNAQVTSVIAGPRTFEQWESYLAGLARPFSAEDEAFMSALVPAGHPSTPGYTDPAYPVTGRTARVA